MLGSSRFGNSFALSFGRCCVLLRRVQVVLGSHMRSNTDFLYDIAFGTAWKPCNVSRNQGAPKPAPVSAPFLASLAKSETRSTHTEGQSLLEVPSTCSAPSRVPAMGSPLNVLMQSWICFFRASSPSDSVFTFKSRFCPSTSSERLHCLETTFCFGASWVSCTMLRWANL